MDGTSVGISIEITRRHYHISYRGLDKAENSDYGIRKL
jgi:hypothetical protein